jgi:hypothetical protein
MLLDDAFNGAGWTAMNLATQLSVAEAFAQKITEEAIAFLTAQALPVSQYIKGINVEVRPA